MGVCKILFVGVGSIAKRHIKNLFAIEKILDVEFMIDAFRRGGEPVAGVRRVFSDVNDVPNTYDVIFITNPTQCHFDALTRFKDKGKHFFVEKPIVSSEQIQQAKLFDLNKESVYYVASPLRYNAVVQYIKDNIPIDDVISVRSISSSYLPDWRPGIDYRDTYSAHRNLGGGVSIDLIHEWDYLTYLFGWPKNIMSFIGKKSELEIDSDDYAIYIAEYESMIAELHLDYFGRKSIREIQMFTKKETIIGDILNNRVRFMLSGETVDFCEERDDYQIRELLYFFGLIKNGTYNENGYQHAIRVLELTGGWMSKDENGSNL